MTPAHAAAITAVALSPSGDLALSGDERGSRIVWPRGGDPRVLPQIELPPPTIHLERAPSTVRWVVFSGDGRTAATSFESGAVAITRLPSGDSGPVVVVDLRGAPDGPWTRLHVPSAPSLPGCGVGEPRPLEPPALSSDGQRLLTAGVVGDEAGLRLWSTATGQALATWTSDASMRPLGFEASGVPVAQVGTELVVLSEPPRFVAHGVLFASPLRPDGTLLVHGEGGTPTFHRRGGGAGPPTDAPAPVPSPLGQDLPLRIVEGRIELR